MTAVTDVTAAPRSLGWQTRRMIRAGGPALLAVLCGVVVLLLGWIGVDQAAQAYRVTEVRLHGLVLWDSGWYGGNLPLGYSVLFPVLGALVGVKTVALASAALAAWAFDRLVTRALGRRPLGSWYFAVSTALAVTIGQLPWLAGMALGLAALVALSAPAGAGVNGWVPGQAAMGWVRRSGWAGPAGGVVLGVAATLCSPLAGAFLAMACLAWALSSSGFSWRGVWSALTSAPVATAACALAVIGVSGVVFPGQGPFPFPWTSMLVTELLCGAVVVGVVRAPRVVRIGAALYAVSTLVSFVVPNPLGGNAPRLAAAVGVPLFACLVWPATGGARRAALRLGQAGRRRLGQAGRTTLTQPGRRRLGRRAVWPTIAGFVALIAFAVWQWAPGRSVTDASHDPSVQSSFYQPLLSELAAVSSGPVRVEIPPTQEHWEAAYVAPHVSLARGWERQLDIKDNPIFYTDGALTAQTYAQWLVANGVTWVALPSAPLDYAGQAEGALLASGRVPNLAPVWSDATWRLWTVTNSPGLVSGPATLTSLQPDKLTLAVSQPSTVTVRVRYTSYWSASGVPSCVSSDSAGWTVVTAQQAGTVDLTASLIGSRQPASCPSR